MSITTPSGASAYTQGQIASQVGSAVAVFVMNAQRQAGAGVLKMLDAATGGRASTASVNGVGGSLDVTG